ncbi:unnamed protein product [Vicia faba]|uniref:Uncharacterized protein n=1 Tax=Vicia faba TaxID=3906 RepID=A0AAV1AWE2_VICFA|nr:unnamed protein product [Vicia faba]
MNKGGEAGGYPTTPELSLWNSFAFDIVAFSNHLFSIPKNFPDDYQMFYALSLTQLLTLLEVQLVDGLNKLLEKAQSSLEIMEERVSQLTDEVVVASVHHFEEARRRVALLYPHLDLSPLDPFKVVLNGKLVDEE